MLALVAPPRYLRVEELEDPVVLEDLTVLVALVDSAPFSSAAEAFVPVEVVDPIGVSPPWCLEGCSWLSAFADPPEVAAPASSLAVEEEVLL